MLTQKAISKFSAPMLLLMTIIFFYGFSFIPGEVEIGPVKTVEVDLFYDITPDSLLSSNGSYEIDPFFIPAYYNAGSDVLDVEFAPVYHTNYYTKEPASDYEQLLSKAGITGNLAQFAPFFEALRQSKSTQVRIAHFGDSAIEGDNISSQLRENFQVKYGGNGPGFINITNQDISFRRTTAQSFSDNWRTFSVTGRKSKNHPVGISGSVSVPKGKAWVLYKPNWGFKTMREFSLVRVFYTDAEPSAIEYELEVKKGTAELVPGADVQELIIPVDGVSKQFKLITQSEEQAHFYGVSLESKTGVCVDNYPLRGNVGDGITDIDKSVFQSFQNYLDYKLIILQFGLNVLDQNMENYDSYEKKMIKVVNYLKEVAPNAAILLVGVGDRGQKRGSSFITHPNVPKLVAAQQHIAKETNIAFWNLYEAMGGEKSMADWVKRGLGSVDYTHLTVEGSAETANMLFDAIINVAK